MHTNVIDIQTARKPFTLAVARTGADAVILTLKTKRDRQLAQLNKAERLFITAETLAELPGGRTRAIEMMMRISVDKRAGRVQGRAASWLWDNLRALVKDESDLPVAPRLRRRALSE